MTPEERYLFDTHGFLLIEDVLGAGELRELNGLIDSYDIWSNLGEAPFDEVWTNDPNFVTVGPAHTWDEPFRRLLDHPKVLPYLTELLEPKLRYDQGHILLMREGGGKLQLHGGGAPYRSDFFYHSVEGRMFNGMVAVSFALTETLPGKGGFAAIPGSHKANFPCPKAFLNFEKTGDWVVHVPAKAGSAIVFTEALTHGTWPWTAKHERRSLLYKYTPGHIAWSGRGDQTGAVSKAIHLYHQESVTTNGWTEQQRRLLTEPYYAGRPDVMSGS
jgi:hypothetical protein